MNIAAELTGGDPRSLGKTEYIVELVLANRTLLNELLACLFVDDPVVRMRAADGLEKICRQQPGWFVPYKSRLLDDVPVIRQASVQWHLAQMLSELPLTNSEKHRATSILVRNLETMDDWIVVNLTLESLAGFTRERFFDPGEFVRILRAHRQSRHKSVGKRVERLLKEFENS